jgi:hypothetical protein
VAREIVKGISDDGGPPFGERWGTRTRGRRRAEDALDRATFRGVFEVEQAPAPTRHSGVQIAGINRGGRRILNPGADETLHGGDEVLLLGTPEQMDVFKAYVRGETDQARIPD